MGSHILKTALLYSFEIPDRFLFLLKVKTVLLVQQSIIITDLLTVRNKLFTICLKIQRLPDPGLKTEHWNYLELHSVASEQIF